MTSDDSPDRGDPAGPDPSLIGAARERRLELGEAADVTEACLARPASEPTWASGVSEALATLRTAFAHHVEEVERPGGLLPRLLDDEPRLANGVSRMYDEHDEIDELIAAVTDLVCGCSPECSHTSIEEVRVGTLDVLKSISRHRQAGADLVYEAYHVDIGGG